MANTTHYILPLSIRMHCWTPFADPGFTLSTVCYPEQKFWGPQDPQRRVATLDSCKWMWLCSGPRSVASNCWTVWGFTDKVRKEIERSNQIDTVKSSLLLPAEYPLALCRLPWPHGLLCVQKTLWHFGPSLNQEIGPKLYCEGWETSE